MINAFICNVLINQLVNNESKHEELLQNLTCLNLRCVRKRSHKNFEKFPLQNFCFILCCENRIVIAYQKNYVLLLFSTAKIIELRKKKVFYKIKRMGKKIF